MTHKHSGSHSHAPQSFRRAFMLGIILNSAYVVVELTVGLWIGSLGLISDAGHNASDVLSLIIAWLGARLALRPASERFSYGLKRSPIIASLFNALLLFGALGVVTWEAVQRLQNPTPVPGATIIWVTAIGLVVNFGTAFLFVKGRDDLNIRGAFLHMIADGLVTLGVLLAGVAILITGAVWLDPVISLVIVAVVLWSTWGLFKDAMRLSLDAVPSGIETTEVRAYLKGLPGVKDVHDLHIWSLSTTEVALTAHLVVAIQGADSRAVLQQARLGLHDNFEIVHTTLQLEYGGRADDCVDCEPATA